MGEYIGLIENQSATINILKAAGQKSTTTPSVATIDDNSVLGGLVTLGMKVVVVLILFWYL